MDPRLQQVLDFPLVIGMFGRRSRRFGLGGTYDPATGGPFCENSEVKQTVQPYSQAQIDCMGEMAEHIYRRYGRFPARYPTILLRIYAQAHHLELEFYDRFFEDGAYLQTHAEHMKLWHADETL